MLIFSRFNNKHKACKEAKSVQKIIKSSLYDVECAHQGFQTLGGLFTLIKMES